MATDLDPTGGLAPMAVFAALLALGCGLSVALPTLDHLRPRMAPAAWRRAARGITLVSVLGLALAGAVYWSVVGMPFLRPTPNPGATDGLDRAVAAAQGSVTPAASSTVRALTGTVRLPVAGNPLPVGATLFVAVHPSGQRGQPLAAVRHPWLGSGQRFLIDARARLSALPWPDRVDVAVRLVPGQDALDPRPAWSLRLADVDATQAGDLTITLQREP